MKKHLVNVLFINNNEEDKEKLYRLLNEAGLNGTANYQFYLHNAENVTTGKQILTRENINVIITDLNLPDASGVEPIVLLNSLAPELPIVVYSSFSDAENAIKAIEYGAQDYVVKDKLDSYFLKRVLFHSIERKKYEEKIKEIEKMLNQQIDDDLTGVFYTKPDGTILKCNQAFLDIFGFESIEEALNTNIVNVYHNSGERAALLEELRNNKRLFKYELELKHKSGRKISCLLNLFGIFNKNEELIQIKGYLFDITEKKAAHEKLRIINRAIEQSPESIILADRDGNIEFVNKKFTEITGYESEKVIGKNPKFLKSGKTPESTYKDLWDTILSGKDWRGEFVNKKKNGDLYYENASISPVLDEKGNITHFLAIKEDITDKRVAQERINLLAHAIKSVHDCVCITDTENKIIFVNDTFLKTYGYESDELIGKNISIVRAVKKEENFKQILSDTLNGNWQGEIMQRRKDGSEFPVELSTSQVLDDNGKTLALVGIARDVSEQKKMVNEIIQAKEKAEAADKLKSEFLSQISHEIRTPLNVLISYSNFLQDNYFNSEDQELSEIFTGIESAGYRIIRTIDMILNASEIQLGTYEPKFTNFNLIEEVFDIIVPRYAKFAKDKGIKLIYNKNLADSILYGDSYSILQIFTNLIDNAVKYTDEGSIEITIDKNDEGNIFVTVSDTGIGISSDYMNSLFEPFTQEQHGYSRRYDGNGLGLSLVKKYCDINNAIISVNSIKNQGTSFTVVFK